QQVVGVFKPVSGSSLDAVFRNQSSQGVWELHAVDGVSGDVGKIVDFQLAFEYTDGKVPSILPLQPDPTNVTLAANLPAGALRPPQPAPAGGGWATAGDTLPNGSRLVRPELANTTTALQVTSTYTPPAPAERDVWRVHTAPDGTPPEVNLFPPGPLTASPVTA